MSENAINNPEDFRVRVSNIVTPMVRKTAVEMYRLGIRSEEAIDLVSKLVADTAMEVALKMLKCSQEDAQNFQLLNWAHAQDGPEAHQAWMEKELMSTGMFKKDGTLKEEFQ